MHIYLTIPSHTKCELFSTLLHFSLIINSDYTTLYHRNIFFFCIPLLLQCFAIKLGYRVVIQVGSCEYNRKYKMPICFPLLLAEYTAFCIPGVSTRSIILLAVQVFCHVYYTTGRYCYSCVLFFFVLFTTSFLQLSLSTNIQHHISQEEGHRH